jgi:hypothetical protein
MRFLLAALFLSSCSTVPTPPDAPVVLDPTSFYKRELAMSVNGSSSTGVAIVTKAQSYEIDLHSSGELDFVRVTSCAREITFTPKAKTFHVSFAPTAGLEDVLEYCPLKIMALDEKGGRHAWGFIDFDSGSSTLPAKVTCNGETRDSSGVSACQAKAGLIQRIDFAVPVRIAPDRSCELVLSPDGKSVTYSISLGECVYAIVEAKGGRIHRHTAIGFDEEVPRE